MVYHVHYKASIYDYVDAYTLDKLLVNKSIQRFYRPSEERWVNVLSDPIRGIGGEYVGPDRRQRQRGAQEHRASTVVQIIRSK